MTGPEPDADAKYGAFSYLVTKALQQNMGATR
jgi:hypothetical protein